MPLRHLLLALAVVTVWGTNFVVVKIALDELPPLLLATLRYAFAVLPAVFFVPRPKASMKNLAVYGVLTGVGQFGLMYIAMHGRISPGLASLVIQSQVFFTVGLSMAITGERVQPFQWVALALAVVGIGIIGAHVDAMVTPLGLILTVLGALAWALANIVNKQAGRVQMLSYVVWASCFAVPPLVVLSLIFEGPATMLGAMSNASPKAWIAVLWQTVGNTMFGYAAWGWLLARYPASAVAPTALLVPLFGMGTASLFLGESLPGWKLWAAALVLTGLVVNLMWPTLRRRVAVAR
jgi:O-acetylserine/cysteine efflux transporter